MDTVRMAMLAVFAAVQLGTLQESECQDVLPSFTWDVHSNDADIKLLIDFHDNGKPDVAILRREEWKDDREDNDDDEWLLTGHLRDDPTIPITVSGRPGHHTFQVALPSDRVIGTQFHVKKGQVKSYLSPYNLTDIDESLPVEEGNPAEAIFEPNDREISDRRGLPASFTMTLSLKYDKMFLEKVCGGNRRRAKRRVKEIAKLAEAYFQGALGRTLGTMVTFDIVEVGYVDRDLRLHRVGCGPDCVIKKVENELSAKNPIDVDQYHYISADNKGGTAGIAPRGSVCDRRRKYRTAITEFIGTKDWEGWGDHKMGCALTFAHEMGHALGMPHDFILNPSTARKDMRGRSCLAVDGIMNYKSKKTTWSQCSKEAIIQHFNELSKYNNNCKAKWNEVIVLSGPKDNDGKCSKGGYTYAEVCCCSVGCCWDQCRLPKNELPKKCLEDVRGAFWKYNEQGGYFQAVRGRVPCKDSDPRGESFCRRLKRFCDGSRYSWFPNGCKKTCKLCR